MTKERLIIAIDGHSSCGKSTFAKAIAARMEYTWIDSGAMYRAVTLACMEQKLINEGVVDEDRLRELLDRTGISFRPSEDGRGTATFLNGINVEEKIRTIGVAQNVSLVATSPVVREKMVAIQREMGRDGGIVMDGRDIGTVVFPQAEIKIFLTADPAVRAERRYLELKSGGMKVNPEEIKRNIIERDRLDESRSESPLKKAEDAVVLDNSHMTPGEQMEWFENLLKTRRHFA
jgi:CMP/dCMP kinase